MQKKGQDQNSDVIGAGIFLSMILVFIPLILIVRLIVRAPNNKERAKIIAVLMMYIVAMVVAYMLANAQ